MKQRLKNKSILFFSLIFLLFIGSFFAFSPYAQASNIIQTPIIDDNVLDISIGSFDDDTPGDGSGKLETVAGGYDLISFENLGVVSYDIDTGQVLYKARVKWGYEINIWTGLVFGDIFPKINIDRERSEQYLYIGYYKHIWPCDWDTGEYWVDNFGAWLTFRDIDFGSSYYAHDYDGRITITAGIDPGLSYSGTFEAAGKTYTIPELHSDVLNIKVVESRSGEAGAYNDYYSDGGKSEGTAEIDLSVGFYDISTVKIVDWLNKQDIGWTAVGDYSNLPDATIQQGVVDEIPEGTTFHASGVQELYTYMFPVHIQPEVMKQKAYVDITRAEIIYYLCCGDMRAGVKSYRVDRDISVHVSNYFLHYEFEMETDLFMTVDFEGEVSESFLADPQLHVSNMIWNVDYTGTYDARVVLPPPTAWWITLLFVAIIIIAIYIGYRVLKAYLKKRKTMASGVRRTLNPNRRQR